jgi:hypothetical protein
MRKAIFAAVAAVALGASSAAMAAHAGGGGGAGHAGGGGGGHMGGNFGGAHFGGFAGPHMGAHMAPGGIGMAHPGFAAAPNTFAAGRGNFAPRTVPNTFAANPAFAGRGRTFAWRGDHDHDRFHHRRFAFFPGFVGGIYDYDATPTCYYDPNAPWAYQYGYNSCYSYDSPSYNWD